ncbi:cuticle protein 8-like [Adelges cooleyi]|uniref:cuticle protein 8-like n=1 Tax=Adelges cooleyi TaxID=133065 RepID=UPI0021804996|nr:cuticle protein 8-like [Adelges cooleyi]
MAAKMIFFATCALAVCARLAAAYPPTYSYQDFHQAEDVAYHHADDHHDEAPAAYHFGYAVKDTHTQDIKSHQETSDGHGTVKGSYSLVEPDGSTRLVEYTADHVHGFQAKVKKIPPPTYRHEEPAVYHEPATAAYPYGKPEYYSGYY